MILNGSYFQAISLAFENPASHRVKDGEKVSEVLQVTLLGLNMQKHIRCSLCNAYSP